QEREGVGAGESAEVADHIHGATNTTGAFATDIHAERPTRADGQLYTGDGHSEAGDRRQRRAGERHRVNTDGCQEEAEDAGQPPRPGTIPGAIEGVHNYACRPVGDGTGGEWRHGIIRRFRGGELEVLGEIGEHPGDTDVESEIAGE